MKITKRDIADISLVWIAFSFVPYLFNYANTTLFYLFQPESSNIIFSTPAISKWVQFFASFCQLGIMAAFLWFLLFKRNLILNFLFPNSEDKTLELSADSTEKLTDYSFWIKIFGLYLGLHSGIQLISNLFRVFGTNRAGEGYFTFIWSRCGAYIISFVLSVVVIWKAREIAKFLKFSDNNKS